MTICLHVICHLLRVQVDNLSHVMVRSRFAWPASTPAGVKLCTVSPLGGVAVVLLFDVRVKGRVRKVTFAAAALVGSTFIVILRSTLVSLL